MTRCSLKVSDHIADKIQNTLQHRFVNGEIRKSQPGVYYDLSDNNAMLGVRNKTSGNSCFFPANHYETSLLEFVLLHLSTKHLKNILV